MKWVFALAAWLITMSAISVSPSLAAVAITADSLTIGGCSTNSAIGGGAVGLYCAGDIHGSVDFPPGGDYQIGVVAGGVAGWGVIAPQARVSIDGVVIGTITITASSFSTYTLSNIVTSPGMHVIDIAFANGYGFPFYGFALYIQGIAITPTVSVPPPNPTPNPPTSADAYQQQLLSLINGSRAGAGLSPLTFSAVQSAGTASCVGSYGHSVHMEQVGQISHDQFPQDICVPWSSAGENVGWASGSESAAIQILHQYMMNEGPSGGHYRNIMSPTYTTVGIGLYYTGGILWLTEDFVQ
jgi:uncharacterized protein YkwD